MMMVRFFGWSIVVSLPLPELRPEIMKVSYKEITRSICKNTGTIYIDVYSMLKRDPEKKKLFFDDVHPDVKGNALIERIIYDVIIKENVVKSSSNSNNQKK